MSAELSRTSLAVVLGSAGLPGTLQRTSLAVVLVDPAELPPEPEPPASASRTGTLRPLEPFRVFEVF